MSLEDRARPMPKGRLILVSLGSLLAGVLIVFGAILPAEYNMDPLGLGKLSGISRLWAKGDNVIDPNADAIQRAREFDAPFRSDVIEIPLTGFLGGAKGSELEYKVHMQKDASVVYSWEVLGATNRRDFHFDFHGHTEKVPGETMTVATYKQAFGLKQQGALTAPFEGIQGWQFSNSSEQPVVVRLKIAGYYDLIPAGKDGNLAGIVPNVPAAQARPDLPIAGLPAS